MLTTRHPYQQPNVLNLMDSIAEITTPSQTLYVRFDEADLEAVGLLSDELVEMADQGMVCDVSFGTVQ